MKNQHFPVVSSGFRTGGTTNVTNLPFAQGAAGPCRPRAPAWCRPAPARCRCRAACHRRCLGHPGDAPVVGRTAEKTMGEMERKRWKLRTGSVDYLSYIDIYIYIYIYIYFIKYIYIYIYIVCFSIIYLFII